MRNCITCGGNIPMPEGKVCLIRQMLVTANLPQFEATRDAHIEAVKEMYLKLGGDCLNKEGVEKEFEIKLTE